MKETLRLVSRSGLFKTANARLGRRPAGNPLLGAPGNPILGTSGDPVLSAAGDSVRSIPSAARDTCARNHRRFSWGQLSDALHDLLLHF